jgi:hypothetical protein
MNADLLESLEQVFCALVSNRCARVSGLERTTLSHPSSGIGDR